jgi:N-acyl-D-amino-acid deacylase
VIDLLIRGGSVVDGSGSPAFTADVAIDGERVVEVGRLDGEDAARVIDARGKVVCPGFVDPHSHSDWSLPANPTAESTIRQGVTTEIVGNCGWTYAPVTQHSRLAMLGRLRTFAYEGPLEWSTFGEHLSWLSHRGHSPNLAWFVGHNSLRWAAPNDLDAMEHHLREAMDAGALGMSTGLEFNPGREAPTEELVRLNKVVGEYRGWYTSHIRNRDAHLLEAIDEFLTIAREGGTRAEISHLNVRHNTGAPEDGWRRAVEKMAAARETGLDVLADTTPLRDGIGQMAGILPQWVMADGVSKACELLRDRSVRERLRGECDRYWRFIHRGEWHRVRLQTSAQFREYEGLSFPQIAEQRGTDEWDAFFDILAGSGDALESVLMVGELFTDEHVHEMAAHPLFCLGVDTFTSRIDGPLADVTRHPLSYAGHVHYLTHHVREAGVLKLEEAIHKMTAMPAEHFGLSGRGRVAPGSFADVVVLDYEQLDDVSTLDNPLAYAAGVEHVFVNGVAVVEDGEHTGARPGRHLARAA